MTSFCGHAIEMFENGCIVEHFKEGKVQLYNKYSNLFVRIVILGQIRFSKHSRLAIFKSF